MVSLKVVFLALNGLNATSASLCWFYPQNLFARRQVASGTAGPANVGFCPADNG